MGEATIRIKLGGLEVDYQGDETFLKKDLVATVKELLELQIVAQEQDSSGTDRSAVDSGQTETRGGAPNDRKFDHSTDTIATMLGAKSGPGLVMAAAAHMHFVNGKQVFTRKEIIAEMRTATGHIKKSYIANLSMHLKRLTGGIKARLRL